MLKLVKNESRKLSQAFFHPSFIYLTIVGNLLLLISTTAVYYLEKEINPKIHSFFDSLWWGVSTITTVGYGDISPITMGGRIVGIVLMYTGTVLFVAFTSLLLSFLLKEEVDKEIQPLEDEVFKEEQTQRRILQLLEELNSKWK